MTKHHLKLNKKRVVYMVMCYGENETQGGVLIQENNQPGAAVMKQIHFTGHES